MIDAIHLASIASFSGEIESLTELAKINFIFGHNGSGKTTVSRLIGNEENYSTCTVQWRAGERLQAMVYNRDFVVANFTETSDLKGVFTLGEDNVQLVEKIQAVKGEIDKLTERRAGLNAALNGDSGKAGKLRELAQAEDDLRVKCWMQKQKHDSRFSEAFTGYRNNSEKFREKILEEREANTAPLEKIVDLEEKALALYKTRLAEQPLISLLEYGELVQQEAAPVLRRRVIGRGDIDIAGLIHELGNSDWVRQGREYHRVSKSVCPFCQQATSESLGRSLDEYFDEAFERDSREIDAIVEKYKVDVNRFQRQLTLLIETGNPFLDTERLKTEKAVFDSRASANTQKLEAKKKEPSQLIELDPMRQVCDAITVLIVSANTRISKHNSVVKNLTEERRQFVAGVWKYLLEEELKVDLAEYDSKKSALRKAISGIQENLKRTNEEIAAKEKAVRALERETTSVQPTVDGINALLKSFGFRGFALAVAADGRCYRLLRDDGSDARRTLSEGERTFVTFLYFYHLLRGSDSESGAMIDRIAVFDDPISSLDSDILFIVGSLIKGLFDDVRTGAGRIKQIFVLTHNVYFHKEVTFNSKRRNVALSDESFWIMRKLEGRTVIERHPSNPIKTSYELLWSEVRRVDDASITIQNSLRRILENYFRILGGVDADGICARFDGKDRLVCKSLFSWVNDGSHSAHDDLYIAADTATAQTYRRVFKEIFVKMGHEGHYQMMMGPPSAGILPSASAGG